MLVSLLSGSNSKQLLSKWKQIYLKHLPQSLCLLEHMSSRHLKTMKNIKSMNETLRYFNEHSSSLLVKQQQQAAQKDKSSFYAKNKSNKSTNEFDQLKKFNSLVKVKLKLAYLYYNYRGVSIQRLNDLFLDIYSNYRFLCDFFRLGFGAYYIIK